MQYHPYFSSQMLSVWKAKIPFKMSLEKKIVKNVFKRFIRRVIG